MDVLQKAIKDQRRLKLQSSDSISVADVAPINRSKKSVAFGIVSSTRAVSGDRTRYIRIKGDGCLDLNGDCSGPWTEFNVVNGSDGALIFKAVRAERWLTVVSGEFAASEDPDLLLPVSVMQPASVPERSNEEMLLPVVGESITLRPIGGGAALPFPLRVCRKRKHVLLLDAGEGNFACSAEGKFHRKGGDGQWAQWEVTATAEGGATLKNVGHQAFLALDAATGDARLASEPTAFPVWLGASAPTVDPSVLSAQDVAHFKEKGYIVIRDAVCPELVQEELRLINHQLGKPDCWGPNHNPLIAAQLRLKLGGDGHDIPVKSPRMWSALNVLLGPGNIRFPERYQVALRFPQPLQKGHLAPDKKPGYVYHIDGMGLKNVFPFTMLCGVALSDQSKPNCGNLHVFPGSHLNGKLRKYYAESVDDHSRNESDSSKPNFGESVQVLLRPGDVILAHHLLAHRVGMNTSEHIRYQLYYRLHHKDHEKLKDQILGNPWVEYAI